MLEDGLVTRDQIDVSGWTAGDVSIDGGGDTDILQLGVSGNATLTDTAVTFSGAGTSARGQSSKPRRAKKPWASRVSR